ncbi:hypothetical protein AALO_G00291820 [Alosa alosa]|uniref:TPX2 C-terminal domain-containing protein n=1 Tax=Alosa alosa TaxID=278164 RepID=A0AAV6FGY9_9TELE|nr:targeting protein for Xklp2-like [Alosa sapidissima]XP_048091650.1 targeting protein for Xklp2-like [Alosa alosa]KAG5262068.1 hypothetical protein AALO_G00291820 [Alosa alosa]
MEMEVFNFHARPLPASILTGVVGVPVKRVVTPTTLQPFKLLADERVTIKAERRKQKIKEEKKRWMEAVTFKARPNTVTHKEPFRPRKENHASPTPVGFNLQTEQRAREWLMLDQLKRSREALRVVMEQERLWEQEQMEKVAVAKLRREQVHKAQSIRRYKPLKPKAEIPVTIPQSPQFSHRILFRNRF